jgi:hypothetical protein
MGTAFSTIPRLIRRVFIRLAARKHTRPSVTPGKHLMQA